MSWVLPLPLLLFAAAVALAFLPALVRRPTSPPRLAAEAVGTVVAAAAIPWAGWLVLWLVERRW